MSRLNAAMFGIVELGGTKSLVGFGRSADDITDVVRVPTTNPSETLGILVAHLQTRADELAALGVVSFGPLELRPGHPDQGQITNTTKPGWSNTSVLRPFQEALDLEVGLDTDVNGAALGEGRWGAAQGLENFVYLTVGTGIGGGAVSHGSLVGGLVHPEMGHIVVSRHPEDGFGGICPYHGSCLEGMASGPALEARFGMPASSLGAEVGRAVDLVGFYLAQGIRNIVYTLSPERIVVGGGVAKMPGFYESIDNHLEEQLGGYPGHEEHHTGFVVAPGLGELSGLAGALVLAEEAVT
ncbi:MAG: ROK family protein [Acidimicrobiia bacterium]